MRKTPLEQWISCRIFGSLDRKLEREDIRRYQLQKLRAVIDYVSQKSPFYREQLQGISSRDFQNVDDLSLLPATTQEDLEAHGPRFLCVSQSQVERVVTAPLRENALKPRRIHFSRYDLERTIDFFHHGMTTVVNPGQKVLILMPGERSGSVGDLLLKALRRAGVESFVHGLVLEPARTIHDIVEMGIDCLVGIPTQVLGLARHEKADQIPKGRISSVLLSADYVPASLVSELRHVWGCKVFGHYGTTEMGFGGGVECDAFAGYHLRETDLLFEVVDPDTGQPVPDERPGEVIFTTLTRDAMPLIRYRTGDLSRIVSDQCPCGTTLRRLEKVKGKIQGVVLLRTGDYLGIADIDEALFALPEIANYKVSLTRSHDLDRLELVVQPSCDGLQFQTERIFTALKKIHSIARAVQERRLVLQTPYFSPAGWIATSTEKRAIVQRNENG